MAQGNATERLNTILTQGSSVPAAKVVSVLDEPEATTTGAAIPRATDSGTPLHDDPEVPDISTLLLENEGGAPDIDAMLQQILGGANTGAGAGAGAGQGADIFQQMFSGAAGAGGADGAAGMGMFQEMMKSMADGQTGVGGVSPEHMLYQAQLEQYHAYEQKRWKMRFLVVRMLLHTVNFVYHYVASNGGMAAASYAYVRKQAVSSEAQKFFRTFITLEVVIIGSYFMVLSQQKLLRAFSRDHIISKGLSMVSAFVPAVTRYQLLVDTALVYWSGVSIFLGDLMLAVFYFGIVSVLG